ncbi:MAG: EAL domain-containing protein [Burkholderiaceae bacterium]|jgi:diguanylate cyclase (GGDEF)-like protein/PAS domain S-box-containing protein|nr:EAL domain-containing protein [Burkholderiaceae bacterium]
MKSFTDSIAFIDEEAERLKTALLYRNSSMAQVVNVVASAALAYINVNLDAPVFWAVCWWLSMVSVSAARLMLARQFVRNSPSAFQAPAWRRRFIIVTGLMTTVWAVGAVLFVWNASDTARLFTGLVLSGMVAGALPLLAPVPLAFRLFAVGITVPMALALFLQAQSGLHWAFGGLILVFMASMLVGANYLHETLDEATRLGLANARIEQHLQQAKGIAKSALSDRMEAESILEVSEERHRLTLENLPAGIIRFNRDLTVIYANTRLMQILQTPMERIIGYDLNKLSDANILAIFRQAIAGKRGSYEGEYLASADRPPVWVGLTCIPAEAGQGDRGDCIAVIDDISERKQAEGEIQRLAFTDSLTELPNRRLLNDRMRQALAACSRTNDHGALILIDLDHFKTLNDTQGHAVGDLLLRQVATRLVTCVRDGDTVARLGGDEFVIMLKDLDTKLDDAATQAQVVGEKVINVLSRPYELAGHVYHSTPSLGITLFDGQKNSIDDLLKQADLAMYQAKAGGRSTMRFFSSEMQTVMLHRIALEADIRKGLVRREFALYFQPQVDVDSHVVGAEALLRWNHPLDGVVTPSGFIGLAEDTGLIRPLGLWVLEEGCHQLERWANDSARSHLTLAINVSAHQFNDARFVDQLLDVLARTGANPNRLKLELTESMLVSNVDEVAAKMFALKARGVGFSLDDFGTGYSSLSYLKRLPLDQLKIDQGFVRDILVDPNDAAIAKMVLALAKSMGLAVIAEGVETQAQREYLYRIGCRAYQGYLYGHPMTIADFELSTASNLAAVQAPQALLPI